MDFLFRQPRIMNCLLPLESLDNYQNAVPEKLFIALLRLPGWMRLQILLERSSDEICVHRQV